MDAGTQAYYDNTIVAGASLAGTGGAVYVFERDADTGGWSEAAVLTPNSAAAAAGMEFGYAVAMHRSVGLLAVGARRVAGQVKTLLGFKEPY